MENMGKETKKKCYIGMLDSFERADTLPLNTSDISDAQHIDNDYT